MGERRRHVAVLGPFEVRVDDVVTGPAGARRRGLLAVLALAANDIVPVSVLVDRVWGEDPPESVINVVQTYVSAWRKVLGRDAVTTVGAGYRLVATAAECDLLAFRELVERGRAADAGRRRDEAARCLGAALRVWRGPALVDLSGEPWHALLTTGLELERLTVTDSWGRASLLSAAVDPAEVVTALSAVHAREPMRETTTEVLMWALTATGQQAAALDAFTTTRRRLRTELGADPGQALTEMHARVLRRDPGLQAAGRQARRGQSTPASHAGVARPDSFVGRARDMDQVRELLSRHRLVTLTGAGGSGKTRLATEVHQREVDAGGPGWFVDLTAVPDATFAPATVAAAVGLQAAAGTDQLGALAEHLAGSSGLLVLDNLEHLPDVGDTVAELCRTCRDLRVLVTSRAPLRVAGEQQYPVPLLAVPSADETPSVAELQDVDSVQLLVDRARAHQPDFAVTAANAADVAAIVRRLDGLPLAVEIVAPWLRLLTPADLATKLTAPLDLPGRRADVPTRHRTLRDTIAWSYDLLPAPEQRLLCSLAVFAGGFTVGAVEGVCSGVTSTDGPSVAEVLFDLVDKNLVQAGGSSPGGHRFRLLQAVREFAQEKAGAVLGPAGSTLRDRHAEWYSGWCTQLATHSEGPESDTWLEAAVAEADNIRAAIDTWASSRPRPDHLQLVVDAMTLWFEAGHEPEGEQRLAAALAAAGPEAPARAIGLTYWAWLRGTLNRPEAAAAAAEAVGLAREAGDAPVEAFALQTLGDTLDDPEASEQASSAVFDAATRAESAHVRYGPTAPDAVRCGASYNLAAVWLYRSVPKALSWQQEALRRAELEGDRRITAVNAARLGLVHLLAGDVDSARGQLARARELVSRRVTARWEDIVTFASGQLAHHDGRAAEAEADLERVLRSASSAGRPLHTVLGAAALADLHTARGELDRAYATLDLGQQRAGRLPDATHLARLLVRRARLDRLTGRHGRATDLLEQVAPTLPGGALPPERVVWLLESAAHALPADRGSARASLAELCSACEATGVRLPPWEQHNLDALEHELEVRG